MKIILGLKAYTVTVLPAKSTIMRQLLGNQAFSKPE